MNLKRSDVAGDDLIPDFCRAPAVLSLAFIMELVAISLALASTTTAILDRFVLLSIYLQWIGFCSAAVLCLARRRLRHAPPRVMFPVAWVLLLAVTLLISAAGYEILMRIDPLFRAAPGKSRSTFLFRHFFIGAVVSLLVLRLFWVQHQWRAQVRAEGQSRYEALQARIRPHFLFNSLNSIAALAGSRPQEAERLTEDLSDLMRAGLDQRSRLAPLADEITLVKAYLRIEQARLGERLNVEWELADDALALDVPLLSVQPLVENAIYHGVEQRPGRSTVRIVARRDQAALHIEVHNPRPEAAAARRSGQRIAVDNIAQRLALIYGDEASLTLGEDGGQFVSRMRVPTVTRTETMTQGEVA